MKQLEVMNTDAGVVLGSSVLLADSFWTRLRGLLGRKLQAGEGMLIRPCNSVHTFGMAYAIDIAFLDEQHIVIATLHSLPPNRLSSSHSKAREVLELPAGTLRATQTEPGQRLALRDANAQGTP